MNFIVAFCHEDQHSIWTERYRPGFTVWRVVSGVWRDGSEPTIREDKFFESGFRTWELGELDFATVFISRLSGAGGNIEEGELVIFTSSTESDGFA